MQVIVIKIDICGNHIMVKNLEGNEYILYNAKVSQNLQTVQFRNWKFTNYSLFIGSIKAPRNHSYFKSAHQL